MNVSVQLDSYMVEEGREFVIVCAILDGETERLVAITLATVEEGEATGGMSSRIKTSLSDIFLMCRW